MDKSEICPQLVDDYGTTELRIQYDEQSGPLQFSQELRPAQVAAAPLVTWSADPDKFYTLLMIDPDAPARRLSFLGEVRHWLVTNIPGHNVPAGETVFAYMPPGPPPLTGLHRYVFLVFAQSDGRMIFDEPRLEATDQRQRLRTSTKAFASKYHLGNPIGANVFLARY